MGDEAATHLVAVMNKLWHRTKSVVVVVVVVVVAVAVVAVVFVVVVTNSDSIWHVLVFFYEKSKTFICIRVRPIQQRLNHFNVMINTIKTD